MRDAGGLRAFVIRLGAVAVSGVLLAEVGCTVGPDYAEPPRAEPDAWHRELADGLSAGESVSHRWWTVFADPTIESLIQRAQSASPRLREAWARVDEARALRGVAAGERYPDLDGTGFANRGRVSEGTTPVVPSPLSRVDDIFGLSVDASWELDAFGGIRRSVEAATASEEAAVEQYRDVMVLLFAEVASAYVELRTLQQRLVYAEANVVSQQGTLQLTTDRVEAEISPELDQHQAELNLHNTAAFVPVLRAARDQAVHRLSVLIGEPPGALFAELEPRAAVPALPETVAVAVPAEALRQRPDVRRAERELAAQTARVGVATADLYPRFSLSGFFGFESPNDLFDGDNSTWGIGPSFRWNLFDGARVRGLIDAEEARVDQSLHRYRRTVLGALEESENSLVAYAEERRRRGSLAQAVTAARRSVELVRTLYRNELTDFQNVLDSERSLFRAEDDLATSEGSVARNLIALYVALGGGWDLDPAAEDPGE